MQNLTKVEIKKTDLINNYRLIVNIGDVLSYGYLLTSDDLQSLKLTIDNIMMEKI